MSTEARLITAEDLWNMPGDQRRELVRGELRTMAPAGFEHGAVIVRLTILLGAYVQRLKLGIVVGAETGFVLARNPDVVRGADIAFVSTARLPAPEVAKKFYEGAPDLAVEVVSPSDALDTIEEKVDDYLNAQTPLIWLVNPRRKTVTIYRPEQKPRIIGETDMLDGEDVVPGFACRVAEAFS
jgi:Uma2 family endonuclease